MLAHVVAGSAALRRAPIFVPYLLATLIVVAFHWLRAWLEDGLGVLGPYPFLLFFPAVILVAVLLDRGTGVFAVVLSTALAWYYFLEPKKSFVLASPEAWVPLVLYFVTALFLVSVIESLRATVGKLERARRALERADQFNKLLLVDINHRVKNHLQSITSLLMLSERRLTDPAAKEALRQAASRIAVLGKVYDGLHLGRRETAVSSRVFIQALCDGLRDSVIGLRPLAIRAQVEDVELSSSQAVALGLVVNELIENAIKYAFPDGRAGDIDVAFRREGERYCLSVQDTGVGLPGAELSGGTGGRLLRSLAHQLRGELDMQNDGGLKVTLVFPVTA